MRFSSLAVGVIFLSASLGVAQSSSKGGNPGSLTPASASADAQPTFQSKVQAVVVDVVVTNRDDQAIPGLHQEDFQVFEDGNPQTVSFFEEHTGASKAAVAQPQLPPNAFSNVPVADSPDSLNVLLLDALNTPLHDQAYVHKQILKYLAGVHPGTRLAIFIMSLRLHMVQGFTSDPALLLQVLNDKKSGSSPQASPLLRSGAEINVDQQVIKQMESMTALDPKVQASIDALRQFQAETASSQTDVRVKDTLFQLRQLAHYLAVFPGRKNVIWFSGFFPINLSPDSSLKDGNTVERQYQEELRRTSADLTKARAVIYPVQASGLATDPLYDASKLPLTVTNAQQATQFQNKELQDASVLRNGSASTMDELALDTGGEAFYNTNGFEEALASAIRNGARYYTLSYTPTNKNMDGRYRHIQVKLTHAHYNLAYRRGYDADDAKTARALEQKLATSDPLQPLMSPGLPNFAQVLFLMSVQPSSPQPDAKAERAGDNAKVEGPFTRMNVDFAIREQDLQFEASPDGTQQGRLEFRLIAYDRSGNPMNWLTKTFDLSLNPEGYAAFGRVGLQFHLEIDAPRGSAYLRSGVCDLKSGKAGTMEIQLRAPVVTPVAASGKTMTASPPKTN